MNNGVRDVFNVAPWSPAAQASSEQLHAEAVDAVRAAKASFVVTADGAGQMKVFSVADLPDRALQEFLLETVWAAFRTARDVTGVSPLFLWCDVCARLATEESE